MADEDELRNTPFDLALGGPKGEYDSTTIAQLKAASEGLRRLNDVLLLFQETDAETRTPPPLGAKPAERG